MTAAAVMEQWTKATEVPTAREPPEARGLARDGVRLLVSRAGGELITHARFRHLPDYLRPGDVVVVNASATINASLDAVREGGRGRPAVHRLVARIGHETVLGGHGEHGAVIRMGGVADSGGTPRLLQDVGLSA